MSRTSRILTALLALSLLAAACGDDDDETAATDPPTSSTSATSDTSAPAAAGTVAVAQTDLGEILVDDKGRTLYVFDNDKDGESTCYDECAGNWPPYSVDGEPAAGDGVDAALLGTTQRTDGAAQVSYNDRPLYRFSADIAAGDTNGQGVGGVWFVIGPDGEAVKS